MEIKHKGLSAWQLTMMALGTVIGGSFFLGSSIVIHAVGPAIVISYILGGILVYFVLSALSEMTVKDPAPGSFRTFAEKTFGSGVGFVVGWVYWTGMVLAMSSEATAVSILMRNWYPNISIFLFGSLTILGITLLNLLGADKLSKLESGLAAIKLLTIVSFIIIAIFLITGLMGRIPPVGAGELTREPLFLGGIKSIAGSMVTVIFAYAGFEIIGLAASETSNPQKIVPKTITYTVVSLVGLYIISIVVLLPLVPTGILNEEVSPMVVALNRWGMSWAGNVINIVMITAILSTMLAAMFGIGRMLRSLADEGHAPKWLKDEKNIPYRGIIFSGFCMFLSLAFGLLLPRVYLFLVSSGGFALLFTYAVIVATQIRFRKKYGCYSGGKCQMPGYPYTSWITLVSIIIIIISMPFISGQASGLIAGLIIIVVYSAIYLVTKFHRTTNNVNSAKDRLNTKRHRVNLSTEFAKDINAEKEDYFKDIKEEKK